MKIDNKGLQRIYQAYVAEKGRESRESCPSPDSLRRSFDPTSTRDEKDAIVDHLSQCPSCAQEFDFLRQLSDREWELAEKLDDIRGSRHGGRFILRKALSAVFPRFEKRYAIVFLLVIGMVAGVLMLRHGLGRNDDRGKTPPSLELIQPLGRVPAVSSLIFKWEPLQGPAAYVVELYDEALNQIWEGAKITVSVFALPASALGKLARNKTYYWAVTAYDQNGNKRESGLRSFFLTD
jgi:hypothetical protein